MSAELEELRSNETSLREQLEMSTKAQEKYKETMKGLESKLSELLDGRASEVDSVVTQLKQAEQVLHMLTFFKINFKKNLLGTP